MQSVMARQWRIEYPGALYHVLSRGNGRQDIFLSDMDRRTFLDLLADVSGRFGVQVSAYVLMGNHYHLLLKNTEANLSRAMQWFGTAYTRRFHLHNHTSGHLFQGRFKSIIVENEAYLYRLSCYIHRNPIRAGIVERLADYPWSSYPYLAYKKKPPEWLSTELILGQIGAVNRREAYRKKVQQYSDEPGRIWEDVRHGLVYGSEAFIGRLKDRFLGDHKEDELPQHNRLLSDVDTQDLTAQAAEAFELDIDVVRNTRRVSSTDKDKRDMLIYYLWETGRLSNQGIGSLLGLTYSNISRRVSIFKNRLSADRKIRSIYNRSKSQIKV